MVVVVVAALAAFAPSAPALRTRVRAAKCARRVATCTAASAAAVHSAVLLCATAGVAAARHPLGAALSPPLVTTLLSLLLSSASVLPRAHAAYDGVTRVALPLALPLLLARADLRRVARDTRQLLPLFALAALASALATVLALRVLPLPRAPREHVVKIAAALCARHIGGAVNFAAVVDALKPPPHLVAAVLAADNIVVAAYFALLLLLSSSPKRAPQQQQPPPHHHHLPSNPTFTLEQLAVSLSASSLIVFAAHRLHNLLPLSPGPIPLITLVSVLIATLFPSATKPFHAASTSLGIFLTQLFFAVIGLSSASILSVLRASPLILLFCFAHIAFHFALLLLAKFLLRLDLDLCLLVSNAAVGGPTTAAAMAASKKWTHLVAPAMLVGVFGYAVATFIALAMAHFLLA